jgi:hypothetical protein
MTIILADRTALAQPYDVNWHTIACGGEDSDGGQFDLSSTIGQPAAGLMAGGGFELSSGFWTTIDPPAHCGTADFNCDGDIGTDLDIEAFFACLSGTCPGAPCASTADFNADGDVGTDADIESFFRVLAGGSC